MLYKKFIKRRDQLKSLLCVGLDPERAKLPAFMQSTPDVLFEFSIRIVDAVSHGAVAFKPNIAFFEREGSSGIRQFERLIEHLKSNFPEIPVIGDIKRGDLANTAKEYAQYYFESLGLDAITLSPYMGRDSLEPFLKYADKTIFLLCLTSNPGSKDFQRRVILPENRTLYEIVAAETASICKEFQGQAGIVVGATHPKEIENLRELHHDLLFLIPGYGAQGGNLAEIMEVCGKNSLINSSRGIHFASQGKDFAEKAYEKVMEINREMGTFF
ncbi:MAG: orotidine-5'-phosphate decarboxylase [Leptospira sp.]|nr:orotidine-5'-phosphate decarboxylase [Leptospira sp.]